MTDPRRAADAHSTDMAATGSHELDTLRAMDAPLVEFVTAGGFLGFTPEQMFPGEAA